MSTKHGSKLSSMLDMLFHFVAFPYMHYSQSYGHQTRRGAILKNELNIKGMHM